MRNKNGNINLSDSYLHQDPDFSDLINIIASEMGMNPILVEKDYWIMHCLFGLQKAGKTFYLKGGTSLSKGFKIIDRFSEDIDILIEPTKDQIVKTGRNHDKSSHIETRKQFFSDLAKEITIDGIESIKRDTAFDDKTGKFRGAGIRLLYQSSLDTPSDIKDGILLEVGFDKVSPYKKVTISSWAFDYAQEKGISYIDNRALNVPCYLPGFTFVEKLHAINKKYSQQQAGKGFDANFMRHYYDLHKLLGLKEVLDFIRSEDYLAHKKSRFKDDGLNQATLLNDVETYAEYEKRYNLSKTLYYKDKPSFAEIMAHLRKAHSSL